jgi:hypothetical protein
MTKNERLQVLGHAHRTDEQLLRQLGRLAMLALK